MTSKIINISDFNPTWNWLADSYPDKTLNWKSYSSLNTPIPTWLPKHQSIRRAYAALSANMDAKFSKGLLVSHGPRPTMYTSKFAKAINPDLPLIAASFTFTELPTGLLHKTMIQAYQQPTKFFCYSNIERKIYSEYFNIPIEKIDMFIWSIKPPMIDENEAPYLTGEYFCALGTEGRDYKTLFAAMKALPSMKCVVVATWKSLEGLDVPDNVEVINNIPLSTCMNILANSKFMVLPLKSKHTTCGHSTLVMSMFYKKSILITNAPAIHDYIEEGKTGLYFEPQDVKELTLKIESLWDDPTKTAAMNEAAYEFATTHCTEETAINYLSNFIKDYY